jgi:outer membrane protein assembly factor BamE (lipoprotein component of BamABCDE complex)
MGIVVQRTLGAPNRIAADSPHGMTVRRRSLELSRINKENKPTRTLLFAGQLCLTVLFAGCTQVYHHGFMVPDGALEQIPLGASQEQVLIVLGTPSTVATVSGEVFYYISQRGEQTAFLPERETDRRVVAVYFDKNRMVQRLANYGLKDGKVFDYISRTTPSGGAEQNYIAFALKIAKF